MNDFTASNGYVVSVINENRVVLHNQDGENTLSTDFVSVNEHLDRYDMQALREFFQAEADARLGRWRWPENPDYVVYPQEDGGAWVHAESEPGAIRYSGRVEPERQDAASTERLYVLAARAYFDAHPETKPWHEARFGEVWIVDTRIRTWGGEQAMFVSEDRRFHNNSWSIPVNDPDVRSARRIWPEVSS